MTCIIILVKKSSFYYNAQVFLFFPSYPYSFHKKKPSKKYSNNKINYALLYFGYSLCCMHTINAACMVTFKLICLLRYSFITAQVLNLK